MSKHPFAPQFLQIYTPRVRYLSFSDTLDKTLRAWQDTRIGRVEVIPLLQMVCFHVIKPEITTVIILTKHPSEQ